MSSSPVPVIKPVFPWYVLRKDDTCPVERIFGEYYIAVFTDRFQALEFIKSHHPDYALERSEVLVNVSGSCVT